MTPRHLVVAAAGVVALTVGGVLVATNDDNPAPVVMAHGVPTDTAVVNVCEADPTGLAHVGGSVTNPTSSRSDYTVIVTMRSADVLLGSQSVYVTGVMPGKSAGWDSATTVVWSPALRCEVSVNANARYSVGG